MIAHEMVVFVRVFTVINRRHFEAFYRVPMHGM